MLSRFSFSNLQLKLALLFRIAVLNRFYINAPLKQYAVNLHNKYNLQHNEEDLFVCEFIANCRYFCVGTNAH